MSISVGVAYGNSIPAIMVGVPGTPAAILTVLDGFTLHKRGETGLAIGVAYVSAILGQLISIPIFVLALVPCPGSRMSSWHRRCSVCTCSALSLW